MSKRTAARLFDQAFSRPREARSEAYKFGVYKQLRVAVDGREPEDPPFSPGSAEFDAFESGCREAMDIARGLDDE